MLKEDSIQQIDDCIQEVLRQKSYYSNSFQLHYMENIDFTLQNLDRLTHSEIKILKQLSERLNSTQISEKFSISKRTVEKHRANIISKLQPKTETFSLQQWAIENKKVIHSISKRY